MNRDAPTNGPYAMSFLIDALTYASLGLAVFR
jgi:hypothetical protein